MHLFLCFGILTNDIFNGSRNCLGILVGVYISPNALATRLDTSNPTLDDAWSSPEKQKSAILTRSFFVYWQLTCVSRVSGSRQWSVSPAPDTPRTAASLAETAS